MKVKQILLPTIFLKLMITAQICNANELVISEIFADPTPVYGLPDAEFVEIYNRSDQTVDLSGYKFYDGSLKALPPVILPAGEYAIICDDNDSALLKSYGIVAALSSLSLSNGGEAIGIYSNAGTMIDSVFYKSDWFNGGYKTDGGWTLERVDLNFICSNSKNWGPSLDNTGGTPGKSNSINGYFEDLIPPEALYTFLSDQGQAVIVFSEILSDSSVISGIISSSLLGLATITGFYDGDKSKLAIQFSQVFIYDTVYELQIMGMKDCAGNELTHTTLFIGIADTLLSQGAIKFSEILFDPESSCPEYLEFSINSSHVIDISEVSLLKLDAVSGDINSIHSLSNTPRLVAQGQLLIASAMPEMISQYFITGKVQNQLKMGDFPSLNNGEGRFALAYKGVVLDEFYYNESFHFSLLNSTKGVSLEKISDKISSLKVSNWHSASSTSGYGTPGLVNSQSSDLIFKDEWISIEPPVFSPDNDGFDDLIEIRIVSPGVGFVASLQLYDLSANRIMIFQNESLSSGVNSLFWNGVINDGSVVLPGPYILVVDIFNSTGEVKRNKKVITIAANRK